MLDRVKVPPLSSAVPNWPTAPSACRRFNSCAISNTLSSCTFFTLGTSRPWLVSMARPMLWDAWGTQHNSVTTQSRITTVVFILMTQTYLSPPIKVHVSMSSTLLFSSAPLTLCSVSQGHMCWLFFFTLYVMFWQASSTEELRIGKCSRPREAAWVNKSTALTPTFNQFWRELLDLLMPHLDEERHVTQFDSSTLSNRSELSSQSH